MRVVVIVLGAIVSVSMLEAQQATVVPAALLPAPADSGYASWSRATQVRVTPHFLSNGDLHASILPLNEQTRRWRTDGRRAIADYCAQVNGLSPALAGALETQSPFARYDSAAASVPTIAITFVVARLAAAGCGDSGDNVRALLADGVMHQSAGNDHPRRGITLVEVRKNGNPVIPLLTAQRTGAVVTVDGVIEGSAIVRVYLPLTAVAPDATGRLPVVELFAAEELYATSYVISVPDRVVRELWTEQFAWRTARLVVAGRDAAVIPLPTPRDPRLLRSRELYQRGQFSEASLVAVTHLATNRAIDSRDRVSAQVQLGLTFSSGGEELVARYFLRGAMLSHPCLQFTVDAPIAHRQLLDRNRTAGVCDKRSMQTLALVSLVPGGAQWTDPRRSKVRGGLLFGVSAILLGSGVIHRVAAADLHERYLEEAVDPQSLYARAESHRALADQRLTLFVSMWVAQWAWNMGHELLLRRRIRLESNYGAPTSSFAPVDASTSPFEQ